MSGGDFAAFIVGLAFGYLVYALFDFLDRIS